MQRNLHFLTRSLKPEQNPANLEMRDSDPTATFEADCKVIEGFLSRSALQLEACQITPQLEASKGLVSQSTPQLEAGEGFPVPRTLNLEIDDNGMPLGHGAPWSRGCAESSPFLLEHCKALQGHFAY